MRTFVLALLVAATGCATAPKTAVIDGKVVPRLTMLFTGQPYEVKHEGAYPKPGGPSSGVRAAGGSIHGHVCGMFVDFDVTHKGDHVQLVGSIDNRTSAEIDVAEENGMRHFTGSLGNLGIDFIAGTGGMQGHVGIRVFALDLVDDGADYKGFMRIPGLFDVKNTEGRLPVTVHGPQALWDMPPADQAALLPAIFTCSNTQFRVVDGLDVGFGGKPTRYAPESSAVYTAM
jgi:hypothetical protein